MESDFMFALIGCMIAIIVHAIVTGIWIGKMTESVRQMTSNLEKIDKELEKRDAQIVRLWERLDEIKEKVIKHGSCKNFKD